MTLQQALSWMEGRLASASVRGVPVAFFRFGETVSYVASTTLGMLDGSNVTVLDSESGSGITVQAASVIVPSVAFVSSGLPIRGDTCSVSGRTFHVLPVSAGNPVCEPVDVYNNSVRVWLKEVAP